MKAKALLVGSLAWLAWGAVGTAWGVEPSAGINSAAVIAFPTALNQSRDNTFQFTLEVVDIGEPDLRGENVRYGIQFGDFQLSADVHLLTKPDRDFNFAEMRAKLRVLPLDEIRTDIAVGLLGRYADTPEGEARIDGHSASLFGAVTTQAYLFGSYALLVNAYVDNVYASLGLKLEIYQYIQLIVEADYLHSMADAKDRSAGRIGAEVEGEQNFYFQLFYDEAVEAVLVQIGSGF